MKPLFNFTINILFFGTVVVVAFVIATISLTKKIDENNIKYDAGITAVVVKESVPVLSFSDGIVKKIYVRPGQLVNKGDLLIDLENPVLEGKIQALSSHPDNVSAQTEADVAKQELKGMKVYSTINGVVTNIEVTEGTPVLSLTKLMTLYSNDNIQLLANFTNNQYLAIQQLNEIKAYSPRLNQEFIIQPDILAPDETINQLNQKQIGFFFTFKDKLGSQSLLNNEDLELRIEQPHDKVLKPIDYIVAFWNNIIPAKKKLN